MVEVPSLQKISLVARGPVERHHSALQAALDAWHSGRWVLDDEELGHGGNGVVFASSDSRLGKVAIKFKHGQEIKKVRSPPFPFAA